VILLYEFITLHNSGLAMAHRINNKVWCLNYKRSYDNAISSRDFRFRSVILPADYRHFAWLYADFIKTMMVHRRLYDIFVILIFVATGKLHCYWFRSFLILSLTSGNSRECKLTRRLHTTGSSVSLRDKRETSRNAYNLCVYYADTSIVNAILC